MKCIIDRKIGHRYTDANNYAVITVLDVMQNFDDPTAATYIVAVDNGYRKHPYIQYYSPDHMKRFEYMCGDVSLSEYLMILRQALNDGAWW